MKTRTKLAAGAIVLLGGVGTAVGVASAQGDPTPTDGAGKGAFVCANLDQIQKVQADHATLLADRLTLLESAKQAAQNAGRTELVAKIEQRQEKVTSRQAKIAERQQKVTDFAASHCQS